jgi:hypothetical protein
VFAEGVRLKALTLFNGQRTIVRSHKNGMFGRLTFGLFQSATLFNQKPKANAKSTY